VAHQMRNFLVCYNKLSFLALISDLFKILSNSKIKIVTIYMYFKFIIKK